MIEERKMAMVEELDLVETLHDKILKTLDLDWNKISTELSNDIFEKCQELNEELNDLVQNRIEEIEEEFEDDIKEGVKLSGN